LDTKKKRSEEGSKALSTRFEGEGGGKIGTLNQGCQDAQDERETHSEDAYMLAQKGKDGTNGLRRYCMPNGSLSRNEKKDIEDSWVNRERLVKQAEVV